MKEYLKTLLLLIFIFPAGLVAQTGTSPANYEIEQNMPLWSQSIPERMEFPLSWENAGQDDFSGWKEKGRQKIWDSLGNLLPAGSLEAEIVEEEQRDGYTAYKVLLNLSESVRTMSYLLVPEGDGPFPALLMLHDHGAEFSIGKEKMIRPFNQTPEKEKRAVEWVEKYYEGVFTGDYYAANGYVVLAIDALYWGERGQKEGSTGEAQQALAANLMQLGMSWTGCILADDIRSVDFLASLPYVDASCIGAAGFSMGGFRAWLLSAVCDRVAATASVCWMNTTAQMMQPGNHLLKGSSAYSMMLPGLKRYMDYPHIASLTAPRPLLFYNGLQDKLFPPEGTEDAYRIMRPVWESQRAGRALVTQGWDVPHLFNRDMQAGVLFFFDKHLKNQ